MRRMKIIISSILVLILLATTAIADEDVQFTAEAPSQVSHGQKFYIKYSVNKKGRNFKAPNFGSLKLLMGPQTSTSSSTQIINGNVSHSYSFTYTYIVQATQTGTVALDPAEIEVKGKVYLSNPLEIEVIKGNAPSPNTSQRNPSQQQHSPGDQNIADISNEDLFTRIFVNRTEVYEGQALTASIKLFTRVNLAGFDDIRMPSYNGFWTEDLETPNQINLQRQTVNGKPYNAGLIKRVLLFPQRSGDLKIDPCELDLQVYQEVRGRGRSIFDQVFGRHERMKKSIRSQAVSIKVKPLPDNPPAGFTNAVGDFDFAVSTSHDSIDVNDAFSLKISVSGTGNHRLFDPPEIDFPEEFELYDPEIEHSYKFGNQGSQGSKTYNYTIIPRYPGTYSIPALDFTYFSPQAGRYIQKKSQPIQIVVRRTEDFESEGPVTKSFSKESIDVIGSDIRYLKKGQYALYQAHTFFLFSLPFWLGYLLPIVIFIVLLIIRRRILKARENTAVHRRKKANKMAMRRLKTAHSLMDEGSESFYNEIIKAVWGYISDKMDIPVADLSRDNVENKLRNQVFEEDIHALRELLDQCEMAHFGPEAGSANPREVYDKAIEVITKLDQRLGK